MSSKILAVNMPILTELFEQLYFKNSESKFVLPFFSEKLDFKA
jgi:hypothetical protein